MLHSEDVMNVPLQISTSTYSEMYHSPLGVFIGKATNLDSTNNTFQINASQFTTFYRKNNEVAALPILAHFDSSRYKGTKPMPSIDQTQVAIQGYIVDFDLDANTGRIALFHVSVINITFLGRAGSFAAPASTSSKRFELGFSIKTIN
jgi:hypothetical protein